MNITYIGMGYVGLTHSVILASFGNRLICVDNNKEKIQLLSQGVAPIEEPDLQTLLTEARPNLSFTTSIHDALLENHVVFVAVDTSVNEDGSFNLDNLDKAMESIAKYANSKTYVVIKSTVPVGTFERYEKYFKENCKHEVLLFEEPVFARSGQLVYDLLNPQRVVIGLKREEMIKTIVAGLARFYGTKPKMIYVRPEEAELIKITSDAFLANKIAFVSDISRLCEKLDVNLDHVLYGASLDPRIGPSCMETGVGYAGPWLKGALSYLAYEGDRHMDSLRTAKAALQTNEIQLDYFLRKIYGRFRSVQAKKIAVLGASYKGGTDDIRGSYAISIIKGFLDKGADVNLYDPLAEDNIQPFFSRHTHIKYCDYYQDALKGADFCVILNKTKEVQEIPPEIYKSLMRKAIIFDARNLYRPDQMNGVEYHSIGRPSVNVKK